MRWGGPASPDQMAVRGCIFLSGVGTSAVLHSGDGRQASAGGGQKWNFVFLHDGRAKKREKIVLFFTFESIAKCGRI